MVSNACLFDRRGDLLGLEHGLKCVGFRGNTLQEGNTLARKCIDCGVAPATENCLVCDAVICRPGWCDFCSEIQD